MSETLAPRLELRSYETALQDGRPPRHRGFAGTTVHIVRQVHILRGFVGRWSWRIDTTSDVIVRSPEASRRDGLGGHRGYARPGIVEVIVAKLGAAAQGS